METIANNAPAVPNWSHCGNCPHCGAPVYVPYRVIFKETPPPEASFTCNCRNRAPWPITTWPITIPPVIPTPPWPLPFQGPWYTVSTSTTSR